MRQSPGDPCVFHVNVLNLRPTRGNATLIETIYDLRDITFELLPKHAQAPAGGSFFRMKGQRVICEVRTGGDRDGVKQSVECKNEIESSGRGADAADPARDRAAAARTVPLAVMRTPRCARHPPDDGDGSARAAQHDTLALAFPATSPACTD